MRDGESRRPPILRSIRARLVVIFFLIALLAVGVMYVVIAPPLTSSLQSEGSGALPGGRGAPGRAAWDRRDGADAREGRGTAQAQGGGARGDRRHPHVEQRHDRRRRLSGTATAAVTGEPFATSSSAAPTDSSIVDFADEVAAGNSTRSSANGRALAGFQIGKGKSQIGDLPTRRGLQPAAQRRRLVSLIRSRVLLAAGIALLVALLTGVLVARALTVRLLRLERVAQRVAQGDFEAHFSDASHDELGYLARALADMQNQLEGLEEARRRFIATASTSCARRSSRSAASSS